MLSVFITYALMGCCAGVLAGLLGVGGGLVIVPALLLSFSLQGLDSPVLMQTAVGTSLATISLTALSSIYAHHRRGAVNGSVVKAMTPGLMLGALGGAVVASWLDGDWLQLLFALFLVFAGSKMLLSSRQSALSAQPKPLPKPAGLALNAALIGQISALVGIGGGTLTVPFLSRHGVEMRQAIASSAACGLPIALAGALGFIWRGLEHPDTLANSWGFVYWPALAGIGVFSLAFAPLGAKLAHQWPVKRLKQYFGAFMLLVSARLFYSSLSALAH